MFLALKLKYLDWLAPQFSQSVISKGSLVFNDPITEFEDRIQNSTVVLEEIITANINYRADSFSISHNIVKIPLSETKLYTATANVEYQEGCAIQRAAERTRRG
mgnify:CR=1 FL=1